MCKNKFYPRLMKCTDGHKLPFETFMGAIMSKSGIRIVSLLSLALMGGCTVYQSSPPPPPSSPVVDGGVVIVDEPPPEERVYYYDPGYPPGTYYYNGYYYYGGYRYERDVFVTRYVNVNVRENRYVNVEDNRRAARESNSSKECNTKETPLSSSGRRKPRHPSGNPITGLNSNNRNIINHRNNSRSSMLRLCILL